MPLSRCLKTMDLLGTVVMDHPEDVSGSICGPLVGTPGTDDDVALGGRLDDGFVVAFSGRIFDRSDLVLLGLDECVDVGDDHAAIPQRLASRPEPFGCGVEFQVIRCRWIHEQPIAQRTFRPDATQSESVSSAVTERSPAFLP